MQLGDAKNNKHVSLFGLGAVLGWEHSGNAHFIINYVTFINTIAFDFDFLNDFRLGLFAEGLKS